MAEEPRQLEKMLEQAVEIIQFFHLLHPQVEAVVVDMVDKTLVQMEELEEEQDLLVRVEIREELIVEEQETHLL